MNEEQLERFDVLLIGYVTPILRRAAKKLMGNTNNVTIYVVISRMGIGVLALTI